MDLHLRGKKRPDHRRLEGHRRRGGRSLCRRRLPSSACGPQRRPVEGAAERLRSAHQIDATAHVVDLRNPADIARLVKDASDIDILVNNAGDIPGGSIDKIDEPTWRHAWELKVFGYINLTRAIYAQMKARGHGVIVNDIGAAGEKFDANYICGSAGNAALMAFTRALGGKSLADNIRVVGINPGPVGTDRHVTLAENPRQNPVRRRKPLQGIPERPAARPPRACQGDRRPDGVPGLRSLRLYLGRDLHRRWRHQRGLGVVCPARSTSSAAFPETGSRGRPGGSCARISGDGADRAQNSRRPQKIRFRWRRHLPAMRSN